MKAVSSGKDQNMKTRFSPLGWYKILLPLMILFCSSCERDTRVIVDGHNPPTFALAGSGSLAMLKIHGPKVRDVPGEAAFIVWEIVPKNGRLNGTKLSTLRSITYGKVPEAYTQVYPEGGEAPPLIEGEQYHAFFDTAGANGTNKTFRIQAGKVIE
jgi:hypothetical protein